MSNNPSLSVEFKAINESPVIQSIDRVSSAGQTYLEKWNRGNERSSQDYVNFWKKALKDVERETLSSLDRTNKAISDARQKQLAMESRISLGGGYGPNLPSAPAQSSSDFLTKINAGMVNAAAMATLVGKAYQVVQTASRVIASFVEDAAKWEAMDMGLRNMEGSALGAANATERLYQIAKAPGIDLETATKGYTQLRAMHMAGKDAERTIVDISNTVARAGGGSVGFERTMNQLKDMLATGTVYQKDLKIMKEAMPELTNLMQKAFGTTTAEGIRNMHVNSVQFLNGILTEMEKLPKAQNTLTSEIENSQVAWNRLKAAFVDTEWTKKFLQNVTRAFEAARIAMRGTEEERKRADYESSIRQKAISGAKFRAGPIGYALGKFGIANYDTEYNMSEADIQQMMDNYDAGKKVERIKAEQNKVHDRFKRERLDKTKKFSGKVDEMTEEEWIAVTAKGTAAFAPNSEGVATGKTSADGDKKKSTKEFKYDLEWWSKQHSEVQAEINKQNREDLLNAEKLLAYYDEMDKKELATAEERKKAWLEEESAVAKHQKSVDDWNQKQIDKNREENQKRNAYVAKSNKYTQIDYDFNVENDLILELFKNNEEEMTRQLEINLAKRNQMRREAERDDYVQGLNGATQLSNSLAENIKASIDYSYNAKREAIEKEYALAERAGTATEAMRKAKDDKLAELDSQRAKRMKGSYATMFRIVKTFEIATASVQLAAAALNALNDKTAVTIGQKLANVGLVMSAGANLVSQITSATYSGYFDRGGNIRAGQWGIAGENGPEIIQGPAHVTSTRDTARLMGSGSGGNITVNNYAGAAVSTTKNANGDWEILIQRAAEAAEDRISAGIASGGGKVSQQLTRTFGVKR